MAQVIPFPIRSRSAETHPVPQSIDPINKRMVQIVSGVREISKGFEHNELQIAVFVVHPEELHLTENAIRKLEPRVIVQSTFNYGKYDRNKLYRYPCYHVLVMTHRTFTQDKGVLEELAKVNQMILISEKKTRTISGARNYVIGAS